MADIKVGLKLATGELRQQAREAGRVLREEVGGASTKGKGGSVGDWIARQNANKAAGGVWNPRTGGYGPGGGGGGGGGALGGAGGAFAAGAVGGVIGGVVSALANALLMLLQRMISAIKNAIVDSFREAASRYAKQLTSGGLPGGFVTRRSALAQIIGVSEKDVLRFGDAVRYLNPHLDFATKALSSTTRSLASVTWWFRILSKDLEGMAALLADRLSSSTRRGLYAVHAVINSFGEFLVNAIVLMIKGVMKSLAAILLPGGDALLKILGASFNLLPDPGKAPNASVDYKRLEASPWERMGLVIGQGVSSHPMKATERNTRSAAATLKEIKALLAPRSTGAPKLTPASVSAP